MADAWLRQLRGNASVGVASAGIVGGTAVKEGAITVMKDAGIDISKFTSDAMADFKPEDFDVVISCCGCGSKLDGDKEAWKKRPVFQDWNLDDPPAIDPGDLSAYRRVRDESKAKVEELLEKMRWEFKLGCHGLSFPESSNSPFVLISFIFCYIYRGSFIWFSVHKVPLEDKSSVVNIFLY